VKDFHFLPAALLLGVLLLPIAPPARADVVGLDNGDRLTGEVKRLEDGELVLETPYAGTVTVDWQAVTSLVTDGPWTVVVHGENGEDGEGGEDDGRDERVGRPVLEPGTDLLLLYAADYEPGAEPLARLPRESLVALLDIGRPAVVYEGRLSVALVSASGNTDSDSRYAEGEWKARAERNRFTVGGLIHEAEEDSEETASRTSLFGAYDHFFSDRWYLNANTRLTEDEFQSLDLRASAGVASGYQFWPRPGDPGGRELSAELGLSYVHEELIGAPDDDYPAARWAIHLKMPFLGTGATFFHRQEGLLGLEDTDDLVVTLATGLRFTLFEDFVAGLQVNLEHDESPAPGRDGDDLTYLVNLGYEW
jgi:hypothetical protein